MLLSAGQALVAIQISAAREVFRRPPGVRLPGAAEFVCGVINVRGALVPLVDLGRLVKAEPANPEGWVVLLALGERRCALAVDHLPAMRTADTQTPSHGTGNAFLHQQVCVDGVTLPLLDVAALTDDLLLS
jgi:chemotaxis signal transduction protein